MRVETTITITKELNDSQKKKLLNLGQYERNNYIYELCSVLPEQVIHLLSPSMDSDITTKVYLR